MPKTVAEVRHMVGCAQANLDNFLRVNPNVAKHPFIKIVKWQLELAMADDESTVPDPEVDSFERDGKVTLTQVPR